MNAIRSKIFGFELAIEISQIRIRIAGLYTATFGLFF